jgi:DNA-binding response OmpR family regulator
MAQILLVEPDSLLAEVYKRALEQSGYRIAQASGAQTAISAADQNKPDLVILELQLAAHNGLEFLYEFRSYRDWLEVPVLVHSLVPPGEFGRDTPLMNELNVAGYLYKPRTSLEQLLRAVDTCMAAKQQPA